MLPGPGLLSVLLSVSRGECNGVELEELVRARRRLIGWLVGWLEEGCLGDVVELAHTPPGLIDDPAVRVGPVDPHTPAVLEPLLGWTAYHADWYAALALMLSELPRTRAALARGELKIGKVRVIAERLADLRTGADRRRVEDALFPDVLGSAPGCYGCGWRRRSSGATPMPRCSGIGGGCGTETWIHKTESAWVLQQTTPGHYTLTDPHDATTTPTQPHRPRPTTQPPRPPTTT